MWTRRKPNIAKGTVVGLASGLVATFVMTQFQNLLSKAQPQPQNGNEEPATVKAADALSTAVTDQELEPAKKETAGNLVHYLFGTAMGGVYGALAESAPMARAGWGTLFGSVLWLVADEIAVPGLKLSKPPAQYPASTHASALASHLVYGVTTEAVRHGLRAI